MGIAAEVTPKHRGVPSGGTIGTIVASGEAEIGFQQVSELVHIKGIDYIGPLPPDVQHVTVFSAGLHAGAKHPEAAKALVEFLTAAPAKAVYKKNGLEPG
jgi:molybdate transport system substrate-binding protein